MDKSPIIRTQVLGFPWHTTDPFLFCVYHEDHYPEGNGDMGPAASLSGRNIGNDFHIKDGWRMYHGATIPGFPAHPHRGFETITVVQRGLVDHSDSMGASGRYGGGDVQWMTAGAGIQHSEMFPLLNMDADNPLELFQIWLNLPREQKMVDPHFKMLWRDEIPVHQFTDPGGKQIELVQYAGNFNNTDALETTPDSWASDPAHAVAIWVVKLEAGAEWTLPPTHSEANRTLYFYKGSELQVADTTITVEHSVQLVPNLEIPLQNSTDEAKMLLLQGVPISEPVVQYGPFVMNTRMEIQQAYEDYQRTRFGGWPWKRPDQVHGHDTKRFARHSDGREENPPGT